jgi:hypothetical protein
MAVIHVKSIEAARRQAEVAIDLMFAGKDVIAVHTLASASGRILIQLADNRTAAYDPSGYIRPGREEQFSDLMDRTMAFFQYPDQDAAAMLDGVQEEINDLMLFQICQWYEALGNQLSPIMQAFTAWFVVMYADLFVDDHPFKLRLADADFSWLRTASRVQQLAFGQRLLTANTRTA